MPDNINVNIALDEPAVAASLDQLRYLVFEGKKGEDGVSPTVTVTDIAGGHRVTITDATHPQGQSFDVMDGEDGQGSGDVATIDISDDNEMSLNGDIITAAEVVSLAQSGKSIIGRWDASGTGEGDATLYLVGAEDDGTDAVVAFAGVLFWNLEWRVCVASAENDDAILSPTFHPFLPTVASSDSGKVLTVNSSGQWAAQTAPVTSVNGQAGPVVIPLAQPGETHVNVLNPADAVRGYIAAQGQINGSDTYWSTGYIAVSEGDVVRVFYDGANKNHAYAAEYSTQAQSGFISRTEIGSYASYTVQHDGYVRLSVKTSAVPWANVSSAMVTINDTDSTYIAYGDLGANDGLMSAADKKKLDGLGRSAGKKVFDKFLYIAYSSFGNNAPNSVPHYEYCAQRDYDWIKADIQPTSDGGLVCCHDSGFTLDGNGRITTYNSSSATEIYTLTLAQATALTYASYPTTHVASIDDFLEVCKKYGKIPYITIRDAHMDVVVPALMASLDKFALRSVAVINSSARASLDAVRTADKDITMSLFMNPFGSSMASGYNYCIADGNTMLGFFYTQSSRTWAEFIASSTIAGYIDDCIENGIIMWAGIESDASHVDDLIAMGFSGIHTMQDRPLPIPTKTSDLTNDSGFQTAAQVQSAIAAAAELPSVTASDNGKVLAVDNGEWSADSPVIVSGTDAQVTNAVNDYLTQYGVPLRLSEEIKHALLDCFENVAWINDDGQTYYDALYAALYPPVDVLSISAVFTQGDNVIYDTDSLDDLKQYLVVTATMTDSTTQTLEDSDYTLSGTLTEGTSVITVSYGGKTTTFNVLVTALPLLPSEYQQVEYIANPSNAYIVTTIPINQGNTVHVQSLLSAKPSATANVCGGTANNYNRSYACYSTSNNYVGAWIGNTNCFVQIADLYSSVLDTVATISPSSVYFKGKNASAESENTVSGATTALDALELFRAGSAGGAFAGRVYFLEVLNGETPTAQLYPCYRKADNVVGMYDIVNEKFYTSANSTAFTKGADV